MSNPQTQPQPPVLILCRSTTNTAQIKLALKLFNIESVVAVSFSDAILRLKTNAFEMIIVESVLDSNANGLSFLAETHKRLPAMLRVVLETAPIQISSHALINDVAPCAIFTEKIDGKRIAELLGPRIIGPAVVEQEVPDSPRPMLLTESEKLDFITDISIELNSLVESPNIVLPVLPELAQKVRLLMADDSCSFETVADLVELEAGMSARILQVANSPIYAGLERIRNLQQAVGRLGLRETLNIVQAVIAQNLFSSQAREFQHLLKDLWIHSICTAYSNENIAQKLNIENSKDFFMMGLLHDVGKLLILHLLEIGRKQGLWGKRPLTEDIIRKILIMRHHDLGAHLLRLWTYPYSFQEVIRLHDDDANIHVRSEAVIVTYFSNLLTRKLGFSLVPYHPDLIHGDLLENQRLADALNMSPEMRLELEASLREITARISKSCFAQA
jgi:HD-like signal output (HDOD) protein